MQLRTTYSHHSCSLTHRSAQDSQASLKNTENTCSSDKIISLFILIFRTTISKCFKNCSTIEQALKLVKLISQDNFSHNIHRKFLSIYLKFGNSIHTSEIFISVLVSTISIDTTTLNHDESATSQA